ncbi:hypothetical protein O7632_14205 [Solwaraspora sp. WMMD406]|uniref:hypothetical protein n=1 Tax=Solwaraspora sp. WMMD406 TaxID=3016095 RepID=UPI002417F031|nr:hypothetical protein [Solwaraspora sp. WMMD406]MDG4765239.1 hypothetical protein [Solwaraspora sp. WMMD406]
MTADVSVIVDHVLLAARRGAEAADLASAVQLRSSAEVIIMAVPGSRAAQSAEILGQSWRDRLAGWCVDLDRYATTLTAVGEGYLLSDDQIAAEFEAVGG